MIQKRKICIVSGHYPKVVLFAELTRNILKEYAETHQYDFYYDSETPVPNDIPELHFRRCLLLKKGFYPEFNEIAILKQKDVYREFLYKTAQSGGRMDSGIG